MYPGRACRTYETGIRVGEETLLQTSLEGVYELNERCLVLLRRLALADPDALPPALAGLASQFAGLRATTMAVASRQPFLLLDFEFGNARQLRSLLGPQPVAASSRSSHFLAPADASPLARGALILARSTCSHHPAHAGLLLGVDPSLHGDLGQLRLPDLERVAETHSQYLRVRWDRQPEVWRRLLAAAESGDPVTLEQFRMYGIQLMATPFFQRS